MSFLRQKGLRTLQHANRPFASGPAARAVHECGDCFTAYRNERKALFSLRPAALLEVARRG